jgi:hypothetical protein
VIEQQHRNVIHMKRRLLAVAIASLAVAAPASAASWLDPGDKTYVPTPEGMVDHWAYEYDNDLGSEHFTSRWDSWTSSDRARSVSAKDGALLTEDVVEGTEWRVFYAETNEIKIRTLKTAGRPLTPNLRTQAQILREQVDAGWLKVDGETTVAGRRALILVDGPNEPVAEHHSERLVVDAESFVELEGVRRSTGFREDGSKIQTVSRRKLVANETVDLAAGAANLQMSDHPGATVIRAGGVEEFKAKKKATKRKKAKKAKRRAGRSRRAAR